eukprot:499010_1
MYNQSQAFFLIFNSLASGYIMILLFVVIAMTVADHVEIVTKLGKIRGNIRKSKIQNDSIYEFLGIQYGKAPINELRFRPCELNESWFNETYSATSFGAACIQNTAYDDHFPNQDENCLFLNIWTSSIVNTSNLPIMVFIHGGGFVAGDSSWFLYNPINFIEESNMNVIIISINYRLGPLGFLSSKQLYSEDINWKSYGGLNGVYDQIQALNWIQKYISSFGGNKNNVTIFGVSAGGLSICYLLISPLIHNLNLFNQAIIQSGSCIGGWGPFPVDAAIEYSNTQLLKAGYSINITQLRQVNATKFTLDILGNASGWPCGIDDLILTQPPQLTYSLLSETHKINANKMIIGFNSLDGICGWPFYYGSHPNNSKQYHQFLSAYISNITQVYLLENYYYPLSSFITEYNNNSNAAIAWYTLNGDVCAMCPSFWQANSTQSVIQTFVYQFRGPNYPFYAGHGSEQPFVFDHSNETNHYEIKWSQRLSNQILSSWANYGINGIPNVSNPNYVQWKLFDNNTQNVMLFDNNTRIVPQFQQQYRNDVCSFWYHEIGFDIMTQICLNIKTIKF